MIPTTFRNAISTTLDLGFSYIWIDALCIIQKDNEDFVTQSAKMGDIYANAVVVVSADSSRSVDEGFLGQRKNTSVEISIPSSKRTMQNGEANGLQRLFARTKSEDISHYCTLRSMNHHDEPINPTQERAWCFQEHRLATCVVHFTSNEKFYECATGTICECSASPQPRDGPIQLLARYQSSPRPYCSVSEFWESSVESFSGMKLTRPTDRLPAISGLAQKMHCEELGAYCAGLWRNNLPASLLWSRAGFDNNEISTASRAFI
jgi:hypothetical protein